MVESWRGDSCSLLVGISFVWYYGEMYTMLARFGVLTTQILDIKKHPLRC
ncbi:hypothetical protein HMPREF0454_03322 [Hafnia alvei ATCC 51873]|uniref:Uncharacterized protein n=1 Tax=Hafnia alvei ATCC 51873 TaxID=1002364 RepID=G9Y9Q3_HAFAL|nr:hypothetical protein HMPREF0454_03322 [Hafnia alvei ATCC 51873]